MIAPKPENPLVDPYVMDDVFYCLRHYSMAPKEIRGRGANCSCHVSFSDNLLFQNAICLSVDFLLISFAQFALMFHLRGASLCISGVTGVRHRVFALLWQPEFFFWLGVLLRCCKFCSPSLESELRYKYFGHTGKRVAKNTTLRVDSNYVLGSG